MDRKFMIIVLVFFLVLGSFSAAVFFDQDRVQQARATNPCQPVLNKSFLVSIPKDVKLGQSCEVSVFARCEDESAVTGAKVVLNITNGSSDPLTALTDESGRAVFNVKGTGLATITARINDNLALDQTVSCNFE